VKVGESYNMLPRECSYM